MAEEKKVMEALRDNGYPSGFVHRHSDNRAPRQREDNQRVPRTSLTLPYISSLAETVKRILRPLDLKVVFHLPSSHSTSPTGSPQGSCTYGPTDRSGVSDPLLICPKVYIGQSGRSLKHRLSEHRRALRNGDVAASALAEHTWSTGHHVDLSKAEVVDSQPFVTTRCLLESWHIQHHPVTLNRERGTLPREYTALLD